MDSSMQVPLDHTRYVFIDGGYLAAFARRAGEQWFGKSAELDYSAVSRIFGGKRTFFYDCIPARTEAESEADYEAKVAQKEALFDEIRRIPGWHVSEGIAKWRKKAGATQKEVDILIAVDMLTHTYRKNMDSIVFIAGDQDFRPLVEAVVREGMWVDLRYAASSISRELKNTVDNASEIQPNDLMEMCTRAFRESTGVPNVSRMHQHSFIYPQEKGEQRGEAIATLHGPQRPGDCHYIVHEDMPTRQYMIFAGHNIRQLKVYHETYCGPTKWSQLTQIAA